MRNIFLVIVGIFFVIPFFPIGVILGLISRPLVVGYFYGYFLPDFFALDKSQRNVIMEEESGRTDLKQNL